MIARLAPGASIERAQSQLDAQNVRYVEQAGALAEPLRSVGYNTKLNSLEGDLVRNVRSALQMLWGGVLFVVLIAAVNIANLSLVRANGRMKELATRNAIGAGGRRIAKQLITEATLLTLIGAGLGIGLGFLSLNAIEWIGFTDLPRAHEISLDGVVLAVTLAPAILLGIVVGAGPALQLARVNLSNVLREEGRSGTAGRTSKVVRRSLVVAQVALAFVLLIGAGLLLASFQRLLGVDPGFVAENVLTGRLNPLATRYKDDNARRGYTDRVLTRIRALPGIEAAGASSFLPFSWDGSSSVVIPEGYAPKPGESVVSPNQLYVTAGYFEAMKIRLEERPLLQRVRHRGRAEVGDRRREPGAEVLAEPGCGRQAHLHAGFSRGRGAPRSQGHLDDRRRRDRRGQDEGARRGWRNGARRRLLRRDGAA